MPNFKNVSDSEKSGNNFQISQTPNFLQLIPLHEQNRFKTLYMYQQQEIM